MKPYGSGGIKFDSSSRLSELSKVLFHRASKKRILAMLAAYFDGSGTDERSKYVVVAGFVASVDQWVEFEVQWATLLAEYELEYAHARRLKELGSAKRDTFYYHANDLLKKNGCFAVSASVKKTDYKAAFGKSYPLTVKDAIYPLAFRGAMVAACKYVAEDFPSEKVAFIIESGDPNQGGAKEIFQRTKKASDSAFAAFSQVKKDFPVSTLTIADKKEYGALQVSDMHAYGKLKHQESRYKKTPDKGHPLLSNLLLGIWRQDSDLDRNAILEQRVINILSRNKRQMYGKRTPATKVKP